MALVNGESYIDYKGGKHQIIDVGVHSETGEEMVVHRSLSSSNKILITPMSIFRDGRVEVDGKSVARFRTMTVEDLGYKRKGSSY